MVKLSYSSISTFLSCKRWYYLNKIEKLRVPQDTKYMDRGTVVHKVLEDYFTKNLPLEELKMLFNEEWDKYSLDLKMAGKKDETWLMVVNGMNIDMKPTDCEYKFEFEDPEYLGFADVMNKDTHEIGDFKTSSKASNDYRNQMKYYAWAYHKDFKTLPTTKVFFLKPNSVIDYNFKEEEVKEVEQEIREANEFIEKNRDNKKAFIKCREEGKECGVFCPYKELCDGEDNAITFELGLFGSRIYFNSPLPEIVRQAINKKFSYELKNSFFIKQKAPWARTKVEFFARNSLPIGFLDGLKKTLTDYGEYIKKTPRIVVKDSRVFDTTKIVTPEKLIGFDLREYQLDSLEEFYKNKIAILEIATSGGKSVIFAEAIRKLGYKTLILVNRKELLYQHKELLEKALGKDIGVIGDGELDIKDVTVGMIQTIWSKVKDPETSSGMRDYLASVRIGIFDEIQGIGNNNEYTKIINSMVGTEYRMGLSGTARRTDGDDMWLEASCGKVKYKLSADKLIEKDFIMKPNINFLNYEILSEEVEDKKRRCELGLINETTNYHKIYEEFIVLGKDRNKKIVELVDGKRQTLILVKLVSHGELLSKELGVPYISGETKKEDRKKYLDEFKEGKIKTLIGTLSIFAEGLNITNLEVLINAAANKSDIKTIQSLGRLMRKHEGKKEVAYYDFIDEDMWVLKKASLERMKSFRKEKHKVGVV